MTGSIFLTICLTLGAIVFGLIARQLLKGKSKRARFANPVVIDLTPLAGKR